MIHGMNHFTVLVEDPAATLAFYGDLLGLVEGPRPAFDFPGAWLCAPGSDDAILHLVYGRPLPEPRRGVIDHLAFSARGLHDTVARLNAAGIAFDLRQLPGGGGWQLFCQDPNGARVELDFAAEETP